MSTRRNRGGGWVTSNPPLNDEYWRETKTSKVPNNNHWPTHKNNSNGYWRESKPEVSKYKSLFKGIAKGKTRKNAFGRGPNAQIASRIRNNAIHEAAKRR
jgi:hypothetical protein